MIEKTTRQKEIRKIRKWASKVIERKKYLRGMEINVLSVEQVKI